MEIQYSQNQQQKQILSQSMQQSLKVLELSCVELGQYLREAYNNNPFLELDYQGGQENFDRISENFNQIDYSICKNTVNADSSKSALDFIVQEETFSEYLMKQIGLMHISYDERIICGYIIESLDNHGYFTDECADLAYILNIPLPKFYECLQMVKALEPAGVAAQCLEECLLIQIQRKSYCTENHQIIIKNHLKDLADGKFALIQKRLHLSREEFEEILSDIKDLEPVPSRGFCQDLLNYNIIPEAKIEVKNNELHILWMKERIPQLMISTSSKLIMSNESIGDVRSGYRSCLEEIEKAREIIRTVEMREITLNALIKKICEYQKEYLIGKASHMNSCSMKDLAKMLDVHESTISRAVKGKFVEWKGESIPLRKFFSTAAKSQEGTVSTEEIKSVIKELIMNEDRKSPLSDEKIMGILKEKGFIIQRRTVAKYREAMGYGSSSHRKYL